MSTIGNQSGIRSGIMTLHKINKNIIDQGEQLSSGKRVNKAEDDAVSYIRSVKTESQLAAYEAQSTYAEGRDEDMVATKIRTLSSANSKLIDTDMAKAHSEMIKQQILQETTTAMLTQANIEFGTVLKMI